LSSNSVIIVIVVSYWNICLEIYLKIFVIWRWPKISQLILFRNTKTFFDVLLQ
jgi:hypothetical protein